MQWWKLQNEFYIITGQTDKFKPMTAEFLESHEFRRLANGKSLDKWERDIISAVGTLADAKKKIRIRDWYETAEGMAYKSDLTAKRAAIVEQRRKFNFDLSNRLTTEMRDFLGEGWYVTRLAPNRLTIAYIENGEGSPQMGFTGYEVDLSTESDLFASKEQAHILHMSYASLGNKDILGDGQFRNYVIGIGMLAGNTELLKSVRDSLNAYADKEADLWKKINDIDEKIKNPTIPEK